MFQKNSSKLWRDILISTVGYRNDVAPRIHDTAQGISGVAISLPQSPEMKSSMISINL